MGEQLDHRCRERRRSRQQLLKQAPLDIVDEEHAPIGELGLGRLDRMAKDEVVGGFASSLGGPAQDGVLFGGQSQTHSFGLGCHTQIVRHMTYRVDVSDQVRRTNVGLHRAAVLGLRLIGDDVELQSAIRRELERARTPARKAGGGSRTRRSRHGVEESVAQRRKLLRLYYDDKVGADLFAEEEARLSIAIKEAQREVDDARDEVVRTDDVAQHFDAVAQMLATPDIDKTWTVATEVERRVLIDEFLEEIVVLPDYLDVKVHGAPPVHVLYQEVGLKESDFDRVGGGIRINTVGLFDTSPAFGLSHVGARIHGNPAREVGTTELWLPAA